MLAEKFTSVKSFEEKLKSICYVKKVVYLNDETKNTLLKNPRVCLFKITSDDLNQPKTKPEVKLKQHTKDWLQFWQNENQNQNYPVRLNPEFSIRWVKKNENFKKLGSTHSDFHNRWLQDRFVLVTTLTFNALSTTQNTAFKTTDELKTQIDEFNQTINHELKQRQQNNTLWYYGLDRGKKELLTLGLFQFASTKPDTPATPATITVYEIKQDQLNRQKISPNGKTLILYKSVSEFIDDPAFLDCFEKKEASCLDLSAAKLIKGKIVINGDLATWITLAKTAAKYKIWKDVPKGSFQPQNLATNGENTETVEFFLMGQKKGKPDKESIYFHEKRFDNIVKKDEIKNELQAYLNQCAEEKNNQDYPQIEKIHHLRSALCANAVGIIDHLQKRHEGIIVFENLDLGNLNGKLEDNAGVLAGLIEQKLWRKLQTQGKAPPHLKQATTLQSSSDKNQPRLSQLGWVFYVDRYNTSKECPVCTNIPANKDEFKNKKEKNIYKCLATSPCGFSTEASDNQKTEFSFLKNSDQVATYNIAKLGFKKIQSLR